MANRAKTGRNNRIWELYQKGYRYQSIANIYRMSLSAVAMVIYRLKKSIDNNGKQYHDKGNLK